MNLHCFVLSFWSILGTYQQTDFIMKNVLSAPFRASNSKISFSFHGTFLFVLELLNHYCSHLHFVLINKSSVFKVQIMNNYITSTTSNYIIVQLGLLEKQCLWVHDCKNWQYQESSSEINSLYFVNCDSRFASQVQ